jgi:hypothetical protein
MSDRLESEAVTAFGHRQAERVAQAMAAVEDFGRYRGLTVVRVWAVEQLVYCHTITRAKGTSTHENRRAMMRLAGWAGHRVPLDDIWVAARAPESDQRRARAILDTRRIGRGRPTREVVWAREVLGMN